MKRKLCGFTLVELVVVIAIIIIISSVSLGILKQTRIIIEKQEMNMVEEDVLSFFNLCKNYCYLNNVSGNIIFIPKERQILFTSLENKVIDRLQLKDKIELKLSDYSSKRINNYGFISPGVTIQLFSDNEKREIVIGVGTGMLYEK